MRSWRRGDVVRGDVVRRRDAWTWTRGDAIVLGNVFVQAMYISTRTCTMTRRRVRIHKGARVFVRSRTCKFHGTQIHPTRPSVHVDAYVYDDASTYADTYRCTRTRTHEMGICNSNWNANPPGAPGHAYIYVNVYDLHARLTT